MNLFSVDIKSPKLAALALGIVAAHKKHNILGLRPFTIGMNPGDLPELRALADRLAIFTGLNEPALIYTAETFEKAARQGSDPGPVVVIMDGHRISKAIQVRMVAHSLPGLVTTPPIFMVAIPSDPSDLIREDKWAVPFRSVFHRHWPWPKIGERKGEWTKLFRCGVEHAAMHDELPLPEIDGPAFKMVKALPIQDQDGARAIVRLGIKSFKAMRASDEQRIRSKHVLVSLPGTSSPPSAPDNQQQASAG